MGLHDAPIWVRGLPPRDTRLAAIARALRERPRQWAEVSTHATPISASGRRKKMQETLGDDYEVTYRDTSIYARYVGTPSQRARITVDVAQEMIAQYQAGDGTPTIAAKYGVTPSTVGSLLRRSGVEMRPRGRGGKIVTTEED